MSLRQSLEVSVQTPTAARPTETKTLVDAAVLRSELFSGTNDSYPREATPDEILKLRHIREKVPPIVWLVAFTGAAQRLAFYAATVPWRQTIPTP